MWGQTWNDILKPFAWFWYKTTEGTKAKWQHIVLHSTVSTGEYLVAEFDTTGCNKTQSLEYLECLGLKNKEHYFSFEKLYTVFLAINLETRQFYLQLWGKHCNKNFIIA